ncbi:hypothetical protein R3P38DRAFT_3189247 [Favolaschia claudopus]|uniref:Uncharacterized protein n=1 Tax=Favolaschia claudopus TaxID=2862362 RepID=A0AAW0BQT8_9AGAR
MPPKGPEKELCEHCGRHLGRRTILKHLEASGPADTQTALFRAQNTSRLLCSGVTKSSVRPRRCYRKNYRPRSVTPPAVIDEDAGMAPAYDDDTPMPSPRELSPSDEDDSVLGPGVRGFGDKNDDWEDGRPDEDMRDDSDEDEDDRAVGDNFSAAPWLQGLNALDVLSEEFDRYIASLETNVDPHSRLSDDDLRDIRAFNLKVETSLGTRDFEKLRRSKLVRNIETLHLVQRRVAFLSGIMPVASGSV